MARRSTQIEDALSIDALRALLRYDAETGHFWWLHSSPKRDMSKPAGFDNSSGYLLIRIGQSRYLAHRLAWFYVYETWPQELDHINRDRSDNRLCNLRLATRSENMANSDGWSESALGVKNVHRHRSGFAVQIFRDGKNVFRKQFRCLGQAVKARNDMLYSLSLSNTQEPSK